MYDHIDTRSKMAGGIQQAMAIDTSITHCGRTIILCITRRMLKHCEASLSEVLGHMYRYRRIAENYL